MTVELKAPVEFQGSVTGDLNKYVVFLQNAFITCIHVEKYIFVLHGGLFRDYVLD
jgi:hypothetical protein